MATIKLDTSSPSVVHLCRQDRRLAKAISMVGTITYEPPADGFAFLIHEIVEQMLSVKAGQRIYSRLESLCGGAVTPESLLALPEGSLRSSGTSAAKAAYIRGAAEAVLSGRLALEALAALPDEAVIRELTALRGIGSWTAKMYLLFVLDRPDVLPYEDGAFLQSYRWLYKTSDCSPAAVQKRCRKWRPYSSAAARYLYRALDLGLTREPFHLFRPFEKGDPPWN